MNTYDCEIACTCSWHVFMLLPNKIHAHDTRIMFHWLRYGQCICIVYTKSLLSPHNTYTQNDINSRLFNVVYALWQNIISLLRDNYFVHIQLQFFFLRDFFFCFCLSRSRRRQEKNKHRGKHAHTKPLQVDTKTNWIRFFFRCCCCWFATSKFKRKKKYEIIYSSFTLTTLYAKDDIKWKQRKWK